MNGIEIQIYESRPAVFRDYDPVFADVAALLIDAIETRNPRLHVDHIGSTAIPGCRGKGIIDLAVTYQPGDLEAAKATLDALGFQSQTGPDPWPETRPMRVATVTALGAALDVHAHVIERDGEEHRKLVGFRDALRADPQLLRAYEDDKRRILAVGTIDAVEYSYAKTSFIEAALSRIGHTVK
jgi:GrpB-like predicted nucleotidyltransferase (UPF0157 family)